MKILILSLLISLSAQAQQVNFDFYRNPQIPLQGTVAGCCWAYPGNALTASSIKFYGSAVDPVRYARWVVVWNPSTSESPTGIRLVVADDGPTILYSFAEQRQAHTKTPVVSGVDVTEELNEIIESGLDIQLIQQTFGNGVSGPLIYASWIEVVY